MLATDPTQQKHIQNLGRALNALSSKSESRHAEVIEALKNLTDEMKKTNNHVNHVKTIMSK